MKTENKYKYYGYFLIITSLSCFILSEQSVIVNDIFGAFFMVNYGLALAYLPILFIDKIGANKKFFSGFKLANTSISLVLFNISAYSLNRSLVVFRESTDWLTVFLLLFNLAILLYSFKEKLPVWSHYLVVIIISTGIVFEVYQSILILHLSTLGLAVFWFFGISLHALVPLCYVIVGFKQLRNYAKSNPKTLGIIAASIGSVFVILITYSIIYTSISNQIARINDLSNTYQTNMEVPAWIAISQKLDNDYFTEKVLKTDLVYQSAMHQTWDLDLNGFNDQRLHDPLVSIASYFAPSNTFLSTNDRIQIIKSLYGNRHLTEERLWNGRNLTTTSIISNIEFHPKQATSYTEYFVSIKNNSTNQWNQNEAIYTFELPEGSAVSSLSLWINGKEEKAYLTTKGKAKEAYNTIVGKERRDPSLVQWKEGNKISVRVFPCTPEEDRKFKIGITSPLSLTDNNYTYKAIKIEGERVDKARQYLKIRNNDLQISCKELHLKPDAEFDYEGSFNEDFKLSFEKQQTPEGDFSRKGFTYSIIKPIYETHSIHSKTIYLDLNANWTDETLKHLLSTHSDYQFYIFNPNKTKVTVENYHNILQEHHELRYSLFPFHKIDEQEAIIIINQKHNTPNLNELNESVFGKELKEKLGNKKNLYTFNIGEASQDYINSLKELSVFHYQLASTTLLDEILDTKQLELPQENENLIYLPQAHISIQKTVGEKANTGNDHIYRLFAYKDILRRIRQSYFDENYIDEELIGLASDANIVTPLSSLIVLESQNDYDRFGISKDEDSLGNANLSDSGAVPEPHEWAFIIMAVMLVLGYFYKTKFKKA